MTEVRIPLTEEEARLVVEEAEALGRAVREPQRSQMLRLVEHARAGEVPPDLVDLLEGLAVMVLQTGRARARLHAEGERLWTAMLLRTPRGQALQAQVEEVNRALRALRGVRLESVRVEMRTLGHFTLNLRADGIGLNLAVRADGVQVESVSVEGSGNTPSRRGLCVWLTGLPGSGKTTIAHQVADRLQREGHPVEILDGDVVRQHFSRGLGFSREDRLENIRRVAYVAELLVRHGVVVLVALVSPYREAREEARRRIGDFLEVYVRCPLEVLIARDPKGLYARALRSEIPNFTGLDDPYEPPEAPDLVLDTDREPPEESARKVLELLAHHGYPMGMRG
ncbi:MAG: adenylyl-sulfate kinase [Armatimonadota bacterium]|nr:adenylyl-sulfate kinase [Armatimonadota bacterium]MDR7443848.1 adenylyl-sulfate kinase [Armatimonadota bacterium]MDR7568984.1 adenylyl-sulfate kinase [Armatimonadota bacterium]MDR7613873.1 adenylyl-sulfate kinase [Armatimonadota bacterium]